MPRILRAAAVAAAVCAWSVTAPAVPPLAVDRGAAGTWQHLQRLRTTASVLYTAAHPDDEQGGVLARLARGEGARVSLLTLNRGEGGDNALGPELFDALGLIRTEELRLANRHYGVDRQYFTPAVDYGFSKRLDEALEKWGHTRVMGEIVRVIRADRPLVVVSRWQGNARDGHGQHQAAGLLTREAYRAAGDPDAFPDHAREGLRPWRALKLYTGGLREDEPWTARIETGGYAPWLGDSFAALGRTGLAFQRSQNNGRVTRAVGPVPLFFARLATTRPAPEREESLFEGIPTRLAAYYSLVGRPAPAAIAPVLHEMERQVEAAIEAFTVHDPSASVPAMARGLAATREAIRLADDPDVRFWLEAKERQFQEAIHAALAIDMEVLAETPGPVVPGQSFEVAARLTNRSRVPITLDTFELRAGPGWKVTAPEAAREALGANATQTRRFAVTLGSDAPVTSRPPFHRPSIAESWYETEPSLRHAPSRPPAAEAVARWTLEGATLETRAPLRRREAAPPYGDLLREVAVVPALSLAVSPRVHVVPVGAPGRVRFTVEVTSHVPDRLEGELTVEAPAGWAVQPPRHALRLTRPGERAAYRFDVVPSTRQATRYEMFARARVGERVYTEQVTEVAYRDLEPRHLHEPARIAVHAIDVQVAPGLRVGYVMGVGDQVPAAIAQLGVEVESLDEAALAEGDLRRFDAIVTGTRAYGARADLRAHNPRLLEYATQGGHLVVLYNTPPDLDPARHAPFPGELPRDAEEVTEEDSPVTLLHPGHDLLARPNRITAEDFDGWVEQRGSKFWKAWDPAYTALVATHDRGQAPQAGGWLTARSGSGRYTYFAYALHRQLPFGVPGAYRLLANLLSAQAGARGASRGAEGAPF
jgi:LmbE family N-acetylglucosaminyl deacetylase